MWERLCELLQPMLLVPDPPALCGQPFPGSHGRQRSDDRRLLPLSLCREGEHTEAIFVVVESDALDDPGDFLRREPAFRDCGIHAREPFSHGWFWIRRGFGRREMVLFWVSSPSVGRSQSGI